MDRRRREQPDGAGAAAMPPGGREQVSVLGSPVHRVTMEEAAEILSRRIGAPEGAPGGGPRRPMDVAVTINPEIVLAARGDEHLARVIGEALLVVPDGIGILWAAKTLGSPLPQRVPGIDLMGALLSRAAAAGWRPYFLGTRRDTIARAAEAAEEKHPGLVVAGWHHGYFPPDGDGDVIGAINESGAHFLLAGMGARRELTWLHTYRHRLRPRLGMGVGGSFDVLAGDVRRAPAWVQKIHGEWLFRLLQEPRRWRRQTALPRFVFQVLKERFRRS